MKNGGEHTIKIAGMLKAAGHPARIEILYLLKKGKRSVKEIHESLGLTQAETSRHLIVLKNASLLCCDKEGGNSFYSINEKDDFASGLVSCLEK